MILTCHTPDCPNDGVPIELGTPIDEDGNPTEFGAAFCGGCGQPITDTDPALEPEGNEA